LISLDFWVVFAHYCDVKHRDAVSSDRLLNVLNPMEREQFDSLDRREVLAASIDGLYAIFSRYRLPPHLPGWPHCTSEEDDRLLHSKPLRELEAEELERFAFKAMTTLGTTENFKHFLPRLLELSCHGQIGYADFEVVLGKLRYGGWSTWPEVEQAAVNRFLNALWTNLLGTYPCSLDSGTCLCGLGNAVNDLATFLSVWRNDSSAAAARHMADLLDQNTPELFQGRLSDAFWEERETQMKQVVDWLTDPAMIPWMETAFFRYSAAPFAAELSAAADTLTCLINSRTRPAI
jgi:hypothetical protein